MQPPTLGNAHFSGFAMREFWHGSPDVVQHTELCKSAMKEWNPFCRPEHSTPIMPHASKPHLRNKYCCPLAILRLITACPVCAELGGDAAFVEADRVHVNAEVRMQRASIFSVHELQTPGGTTIREYVAPTGRVFAVAWTGPQMPDLQRLFGSYFESLKARTYPAA